MAKLNKKQKELHSKIAEGTNGADGFLLVEKDSDLKALVDAGHVEVNEAMAQGNKIPARAVSAPAAVSPVAATNGIQIQSGIPLAPPKRGGKKEEGYPFSKLEVGQSFVVPASETNPKPWETFASTVSSATRRFAEKHPTETTKNRKGESVPKLIPTRKFTLRRVTAGDKYDNGFEETVSGARVFRTA